MTCVSKHLKTAARTSCMRNWGEILVHETLDGASSHTRTGNSGDCNLTNIQSDRTPCTLLPKGNDS